MATLNGGMPAFGRVFSRLFVLQAAWNYERMQGVGFGHAAEPALRGLEGGEGGERYRAALARQTRFFNSHPYFAGLAIGATVRAELEGEKPERIVRLREALGPPLGSLGDRLIWASWLPFCVALGLSLYFFGAGPWSAVVFLALYNAVHLGCRWWALRAGWRHGMTVASALHGPLLRAAGSAATPMAGVAIGFVIPVAFGGLLGTAPRGDMALALVLVAGVALAGRLLARRLSGSSLAALILGATCLAGLLWS